MTKTANDTATRRVTTGIVLAVGLFASLLPGSLATTRTGLTPAGDDELLIRS